MNNGRTWRNNPATWIFVTAMVTFPCLSQSRAPGARLHNVAITVAPSKQEYAPLEIVGFKWPEFSSKQAPVPVVTLRNRSSKPVRSFSIGVIVARADGSVVTGDPDEGRTISVSYRLKWPEEGDEPQSILAPDILAYSAKKALSNCLRAAVLVYHVEFVDGTDWNRDLVKEALELWKDSLAGDATSTCQHIPGIEKTLRDLRGSGYERATSATPTSRNQVSSYSLSCTILNSAGRLMVICP